MARMTAEDKALLARMKDLRELLAEFGLRLSGYDPGVTALINDKPGLRGDGWGGEPITFDSVEWKWLEPLLVELRQLRASRRGPDRPEERGHPRRHDRENSLE